MDLSGYPRSTARGLAKKCDMQAYYDKISQALGIIERVHYLNHTTEGFRGLKIVGSLFKQRACYVAANPNPSI
jgi:hypothetical protein